MTRLRLLFILFAVLFVTGQVRLSAYEPCYQVCGPTVDCSQECEDYGNCGNYDGGDPQGSNGWCAGDCGDDFCNTYTEDSSTCFEDCGGYCGDSWCDLYYETPENCGQDCGYCGDGICETLTTESCGCTTDCTYCIESTVENCTLSADCPQGYDCVDGYCAGPDVL